MIIPINQHTQLIVNSSFSTIGRNKIERGEQKRKEFVGRKREIDLIEELIAPT